MYSHALLPQKNYKHKIDINCLLSEHNFYLIRRVDDKLENVYDSNIGYMKVSAFVSNDERKVIELPGMSVNLLCFNCDETSTNYKTVDFGSNAWDGNTIVKRDDIPKYCTGTSDHINIYIPFIGIHEEKFDTVFPKQGDTHKKLDKQNKVYTDSTDSEGKEIVIVKGGGIMEFIHQPTMLNYWHFELICMIDGKITKRNQNTTEKKSLTLAMEQYFSIAAIPDIPYPKDIDPKDCYLNAS